MPCCGKRNPDGTRAPRVARKTVFIVEDAGGTPIEVHSDVYAARRSAGLQGLRWRTATMRLDGSDPLVDLVVLRSCSTCGPRVR